MISPPGTSKSTSCSSRTETSSRRRSSWFGRDVEHRVELGLRGRDEVGVRDPRAVEAVAGLPALVLANLRERDAIHLGVAARRNERRHAADRVRPSRVACAHEQLRVGPHERHRHRHLRPVRQQRAHLLDAAEDVVPAPRVQRAGVVAELVEDRVHLERRRDRLDQHRALDRAVREPELVLGDCEGTRPQARLVVRLELREIEVRAGPALQLLPCVREHRQPEVEQRRAHRLAVELVVTLDEMPAARLRITSVAVSSFRR